MHKLLLTIAVAPITLLGITGCNDTYYNENGNSGIGGGGYYPGYDNEAPKSQLYKNCQGKVRERVRKRLGYKARMDWGKYDMYNSGRYETTINGRATARNSGRKHKLHYKCIMNRYDAYVRSARIDWDTGNDPESGNGHWDKKAIQACKDRIRHQVRGNIHQSFQIEFTRQQITTPAERRRHVTGEALLKGKHGNGRIAYTCKLRVNPLNIDSARYRWIKPLPPANGSNGGVSGKQKAKQLCQKSLKNRLRTSGYEKIRFLSVSARDLSGNKKQVDLQVKAKMDGSTLISHYQCRVNVKNGKILKMERQR